jgi:glycosyltransferase involved in cell wall biosynthesis
LISVGSLEPRKNQAFLLRVLAKAQAQGTRYELTLVGDGQDRRSLEALAQALGVRDQVVFTGFRPDVSKLFATHRAYVHSSRLENMPVAPIEAMAHGLPVFAAPVGGVGEVFRDGQEGRYWSLDDPTEAARILTATLADAPVHRRMSSAALRRYDVEFAPEVVGRRLLDFLLDEREERATRPLPQSVPSRRSG